MPGRLAAVPDWQCAPRSCGHRADDCASSRGLAHGSAGAAHQDGEGLPSRRAAAGVEGAPRHDRGAGAQRAGGRRGNVDRAAR
eukprot:7346467-Lingulodinium_polyedra.AAC.1